MEEEECAAFANIAKNYLQDVLYSNNSTIFRGQEIARLSGHPTNPLLESDDGVFDFFFRLQQKTRQQKQQTPAQAKKQQSPSRTKREYESNSKAFSGLNSKAETTARRAPKRSPSLGDHLRTTPTKKRIELNLLNAFAPKEFEGYLHMSKMSFLNMFKSLRHLLLNAVIPIAMQPQTVFSLALWKLATDMHFEEIAHKFGIPLTTCQYAIRHFWQLISNNYERFIEWPNTPQSQQATVRAFHSHPYLPNVFSIVATRRISVFLESENCEISVIVQIICNAEHKVIDCFAELAQDYAFDNSPVGQTMAHNAPTILPHSYLIGGKEMPLKSYLMRPFSVECNAQIRSFNAHLQSSLKTAEQVLDAMAKRFNIMYALEAKDLNEVRQIVETVCSLHNLCIDIEDDYVNWQTALNDRPPPASDLCDGGEQNAEGNQRRSELMATMPAGDFIIIN